MAKPYRFTTFVRLNNADISWLVHLGVNVGGFALLTVRGRKSGKPIQTPLAVFIQGEHRYLIATYGIVNWVRNLRRAGGDAILTQSRYAERIRAIELPPQTAVPILQAALRAGPPRVPTVIVRTYRRFFVLPYLHRVT
jgi:deazaflavin-dependent oxidoreductase (nitroreductase family)